MFARLAWWLNLLLYSRHWNQRRHLTEPTHRHGSGVINIDTLNFPHYTIHSSKIPISCDVHAEIWVQINALSIYFKRLKTATCSRRHDRMSVNMSTELIIMTLARRPYISRPRLWQVIVSQRRYEQRISRQIGWSVLNMLHKACVSYHNSHYIVSLISLIVY